MILGLVGVAAAQQTCIEPMSLMQVGAELGEVRKSLETKDVLDLRDRLDRITERLPCLDDVLPANAWAEYARDVAVAYFFRQEEDEMIRWVQAATWAAPDLAWSSSFPEAHPLRRMVAEAGPPPDVAPSDAVLAPPRGGAIVVAGRLAQRPEAPVDVPVFVQVFDRDRKLVSAWIQNGPQFPERWVGRGEPPPPPEWWREGGPTASVASAARPARLGEVVPLVPVVTGGALLVASGASYLLASQAAGSLDELPSDDLTGARTRANVWVLVSGVALAGGVGAVGGGVLLSGSGVTLRF